MKGRNLWLACACALALAAGSARAETLTRPDVFTNSLYDVIVGEGGENPIASDSSCGRWSFEVAETDALMEYTASECKFTKSGVSTLIFQALTSDGMLNFHPGPNNNCRIVFTPDGPCVCRLCVEAWSQTTGWSDGIALSVLTNGSQAVAGPIYTVNGGTHVSMQTAELPLAAENPLVLFLDRRANYMSDGTRLVVRQVIEPVRPVAVPSAVLHSDALCARLSLDAPAVAGEVLKVRYDTGDVTVGTVSAESPIGLSPGLDTLLVEASLPSGATTARFVLANGDDERLSETLPFASLEVTPRPAAGELVASLRREASEERTLGVSALVTSEAGTNAVRLVGYCTDGGTYTNAVAIDGTFGTYERATAVFEPIRPDTPYDVWFVAERLPDGCRHTTATTNFTVAEAHAYLAGTRSVAIDSVQCTDGGKLAKIAVSVSAGFACMTDDLLLLWDDRDRGEDVSDWLHVAKVAAVPGTACSLEITDLPSGWGTSSFRAFRMALASHALPATCYEQDGLLAQWDGLENAGAGTWNAATVTWTDRVGGYDAAFTSGSPTWTNGAKIARSAAAFRASNCGTLATAMGDTYTIEVAATPDSGWQNNYSGIAGNHGSMKCFGVGQYANGSVGFFIGNNNNTGLGSVSMPAADMPVGRMTTFTVLENTSELALYLDAGLYATSANGTTYTPALSFTQFWLGRAYDSGDRNFSGVIHGARIYAGNLTAAAVAHNRRIDEIRFGTRDDILCCSLSEANEWRDVTVPVVRTGDVTAREDLTVSVGWRLDNIGSGSSSVDVYAVYRSCHDLAWTTNVLASGVSADGAADLSEQLRAGTDYEIALFASNATGRVSALATAKAFSVPEIEDIATAIGRTVEVVSRVEKAGVLQSVRVTVGPGAAATVLRAAYGKGFAGLSTNG